MSLTKIENENENSYESDTVLKQAKYIRRKLDPMQELKEWLASIGEDWRDFSDQELNNLIEEGF